MTFEELIAEFTNEPENPLDEIYRSHGIDLNDLANADENHHLFFIRISPQYSRHHRENIYRFPSNTGIESELMKDFYKPFLAFYKDVCLNAGYDSSDRAKRPSCYAYLNATTMYRAKFHLDTWIVVKGNKEAEFIESAGGAECLRSKFIRNIDFTITRYNPKVPGRYHFQSTRLYRIFSDKFKRPLSIGFTQKQ